MANVILTTVGITGDIQPFVHIGRSLISHGHDVTLVTHCHYEEEARHIGMNFVPIDNHQEFEQFVADGALLRTPPTVPLFFRRHVLPKVYAECQIIGELYRSKDTVIVARWSPGIAARIATEKWNIPLISLLMAPGNIVVQPVIKKLVSSIINTDIEKVRAKLGLSPINDWQNWLQLPIHSIAPWPAWFAPPDATWPPSTTPTGFLWQHNEENTTIPDELQTIFSSEESPILITGGSGVSAGAEFFAASAEACQLTNRQGILVTRYEKLVPSSIPKGVKWFKYLPSLAGVMPFMSVVVHHGGMGTLQQALAAGVPQLVIALDGEHYDRASRLQHLGVGAVIPRSSWQPDLIAHTLQQLMNSPEVKRKCKDLAERLSHDDPIVAAHDVIEEVISTGTIRKTTWVENSVSTLSAKTLSKEKPPEEADDVPSWKNLPPHRRTLLAHRLRKRGK